jgi:hypothetical protein
MKQSSDNPEYVDLAVAAHTNFQRASTNLTFDEWNKNWHHIAWTFQNNFTESGDFASGGHKIALYVDGEVINVNDAYPNPVDWGSINTAMLGMYADHDAGFVDYYGEDHMNGLMDEVKIYNKALTADEIAAQWNVQAAGDEDGLIAYYDFEHFPAAAGDLILNKLTNDNDYTWNLIVCSTYCGNKSKAK